MSMTPVGYVEVVKPDTDGFDQLIEARQRIRHLIVETMPGDEPLPWTFGNGRNRPVDKPNRLMAMALMSVHDAVEQAIRLHIDNVAARYDREREALEAIVDFYRTPQTDDPDVVKYIMPEPLLSALFAAHGLDFSEMMDRDA